MHSTLMKETLDQLGPQGDPGHQIEALNASTQEELQVLADMKVRETESAIYEASSEDKVKQRLQQMPAFQGDAKIWLPARADSDASDAPVLQELGKYWAIGDQ